ncbi:hypothetical protein JRQ81_019231 [Phrynocephalus forsythii]|uniref:Sodium/hydrogen exchanger n=1 Tax=Phrynocephalus forsythii TaxID=171643 RepID=A0A9Q0XLI5_9SAUR|nr:hypothetical protein JRQ81_019231 [Phrynocephalus forsythii]
MGIQKLARLTLWGCFLFLSVVDHVFAAQYVELPQRNSSSSVQADPFDATESGRDERLHIFTVDYEYVQIPYEVTLWILLVSLAKIDHGLWPQGCGLVGQPAVWQHDLGCGPYSCLAVFEEMSINEQLYMMIFGESLLNDGITVVLYNMFLAFIQMHRYEEIAPIDVLAGFARFFVVSLGGLLFGIVFGVVAAFMTRFTQNISAIEPLLVFMFSYLSYLAAETLYISGILAITACAVTMKKYVEANVSQNSYTTIKYFMKMLSSISETLIFVFMGVSTISRNHEWNWAFVCFTLVFCIIWRAISVFLLFSISNLFRTYPFTLKDQAVIIYSGLRGASNFSLAFLLPATLFRRKKMFITSTIVVIYLTVFIQVRKYSSSKVLSFSGQLEALMDHLIAGVEDICGHWSHYQLRDKFKKFDNRFLRKVLLHKKQPQSSLVSLYKKLEIKQAIEMLESGARPNSPREATERRYRKQRVHRPTPEEVESMQDILAHNLYQVRQRTLSYNRYNLSADTSEEQAKEILIRRQHSLRQTMRKGCTLPWGGQPSTKSVRYLSLPFGYAGATRREARNDDNGSGDSSNDGASDSDTVFRSGSHRWNWQQQEQLPMRRLHSRTEPAGFTGQKRRINEQGRIAALEKPLLLPKPRRNAQHETDTQECESEDVELNRLLFPSVSTFTRTTETRDGKHFYGPKRHFTVRK